MSELSHNLFRKVLLFSDLSIARPIRESTGQHHWERVLYYTDGNQSRVN